MATDRTGYIDVADVNSVIFTDSKKDDFIIYTEASNQNILLGTQLSNVSAMAIRSNNVHVTNRLNIGGGSNVPAVALEVNTTDSLLLPKGTTGQRPGVPVQGYVRYNTSINTFEGFGAGNAWGSLGGVKDTNQDTYISAESFPTSNDDNLVFYNSNIENMRITRQGYVGVGTSNPAYLLHVNGQGYFNEDITINANLAVNKQIIMQGLRIRKNTSGQANFSPTSVPGVSNDALGNLQLVNQNNQSIIFLTNASNEVGRFTGDGKFAIGTSNPATVLEIAGTDAMLVPKGTTLQRPLTLKQGQMRYNTDTNTFEGFGAGSTWGSLGGVKDTNQDTYISAESFPTSNDDILRFYTSNNEVMRVMPTGSIGVSNTAPSERLELSGGNAKFNSNVYVMSRVAVAGSNPSEVLDVLGNMKVSHNIYNIGKHSIGHSNPTEVLDVSGNVKVSQNLYSMNKIGVANSNPSEILDVLGNVKVSQNIYNIGKHSIGHSNPTEVLDVLGNIKVSQNVYALSKVGIATSNPTVALEINATDAVLLPKGTNLQRPAVPVQGHVRYNSDINTFEGYGAGNAWGSLGGVKDTNQDTYISAESYPTSNDDNLVFYNSNNETMRILKDGNVGIGTSTPSYPLDVNGMACFRSNIYIGGIGTTGNALFFGGQPGDYSSYGSPYSAIISRNYDSTGGSNIQSDYSELLISQMNDARTDAGPDRIRHLAAAHKWQVYNTGLSPSDTNSFYADNNYTTAMYINSTGNVGIGTTSPSQLLHVYGESPTLLLQNTNIGAVNTQLRFTHNNGSTLSEIGVTSQSNIFIANKQNGTISFETKDTERFRIDSFGNVMVGSGAPPTTYNGFATRMMHIVGTNATNNSEYYGGALVLSRAGTSYAGMIGYKYEASVSGLHFYATDNSEVTSSVAKMVIRSDGNVGIGTTTPAFKLDVSGTIRTTASGTDGLILNGGGSYTSISFSNNKGAISSLGLAYNNGDYSTDAISNDLVIRNITGKIMFQNGNAGSALMINSNNFVGVGTAAPAYKLDVVGGVNITNGSGNGGVTTGLTVTTQVGDDSTTSESIILQQSTGKASSRQAITWRNITLYNYSMARIWSQVGGGYAATMMGFDVADSARNMQTRVVIDVNGNVGIGTSTPGYKLEVSGAIYASGDITALSDRRYKQDIKPLEGCLDKITRLSGFSYTRKDYKEGERQIGLIAQEVQELIPEAVSYDKENDRYGLNYGCLVAPLIEAIKELRVEHSNAIKQLNEKLEAQDKIIQTLLKAIPISP